VRIFRALLLSAALLAAGAPAIAQTASARGKVDLTADVELPVLESEVHQPLPEQFI
jgi:uncharacterized membrane protein (DUF2068 family)